MVENKFNERIIKYFQSKISMLRIESYEYLRVHLNFSKSNFLKN